MKPRFPKPGKLTETALRALLRAGETDRIEWKGRRADTADIIAAAVCFANAAGGLILWGIGDDGSIEGSEFHRSEALRNIVYSGTSPAQLVEVQSLAIGNESVLAVWVDSADVVVSTSRGGYSQRVGKECVPLTPDRLVVRRIDTGQLDASNAMTPFGVEALSEAEIDRYREALPDAGADAGLRSIPISEMLQAVGAVKTQRGREGVTVAGLVLLGRQEAIKELFPHYELVYLRTADDRAGDYKRRVVSRLPLLAQIEATLREIQAGTRTRIVRLGSRDLEVPDYPDRVIRESVVNAMVHRHLMMPGAVVVTQSASTLEIENPGGFPEGITPETVLRHAPVHRNRLLAEMLERVRYMERSGLGVDRIYQDQLRTGKQPPVYDATRQSVRLHLDAAQFDEPYARLVVAEETAERVWVVDDLLITAYMRKMGPSDRASLARTIQRSEEETQDVLARLQADDVVARFGGGLATRYGLSARIQEALGNPAAFTRERGLGREYRRSLVLEHARKFRSVTNREVRELLQIPMGEATRLLQSLEASGDLIQEGTRRWARYVPLERG